MRPGGEERVSMLFSGRGPRSTASPLGVNGLERRGPQRLCRALSQLKAAVRFDWSGSHRRLTFLSGTGEAGAADVC